MFKPDPIQEILAKYVHSTKNGFDITDAVSAIRRYVETVIGPDVDYHKLEQCPYCAEPSYRCSCTDAVNMEKAQQRARLGYSNTAGGGVKHESRSMDGSHGDSIGLSI